LKPVDVYSYLRARFGEPNGFQNFLRRDDSDNWIHWDYNLKAADNDVYILGTSREIHFMLSEALSDAQWKELILAIKTDFRRIGREKSKILKSFEKFVVFQNKFYNLAKLCADLHANILDAPPFNVNMPSVKTRQAMRRHTKALQQASERADALYGDCLKLRLITPIMAEAFINMVILTFCKPEIRADKKQYDEFLRAKIPQRLELLSKNCWGFIRDIDKSTEEYGNFMRVFDKRNFVIHGNVDPIREQIETVYFDGKRPLFADSGDHIVKFYEQLENLNNPSEVIKDYENIHAFLHEITECLSPQARKFFQLVINDNYPGFEVKDQRVTRILPDVVMTGSFPGMRYDDELDVEWQ
jgi:hypothetical protein